MSHGPEAHGHHEPAPEPERTPIADPGKAGVDYQVINPVDFRTTHKSPDGVYYTIKNKSPAEAIWRLGKENERNKRLAEERPAEIAFAQEHGLFRSNAIGQIIRPAASGQEFTDQVADASLQEAPGNYDIGSPSGYISYGQGENGSNELAAIAERSHSIVASYEARDAALAEGKTLEEAHAIGSKVYLEQERLRKETHVSQPEASSVTFVDTETAPENSPKTKRLRAMASKAFSLMRAFRGTKAERADHKQEKSARAGEVATLKAELKALVTARDENREDIKTQQEAIKAMEATRTPEEAAKIAEIEALRADIQEMVTAGDVAEEEIEAKQEEIRAIQETWTPHEEQREFGIAARQGQITVMNGDEKINQETVEEQREKIDSVKTNQTALEARRTALLRSPLYELNDAVGDRIKDGKWVIQNRLLGRAGLGNQFIDWQQILKPEAAQHEADKAQRADDRRNAKAESKRERIKPPRKTRAERDAERLARDEKALDETIEPVMRNWNYRGTPQDEQFMPTDWPGNEYETPGYHNVLMLTPTQLRNEFGLTIPKDQVEPILEYINDRMLTLTRDAILGELGEEKLEEFDRLPKGPADEEALFKWIDDNIPTLPETVERRVGNVLKSEDFATFRRFLGRRVKV